MDDFTSIDFTGADGLALRARDYAATTTAPSTRLPVICLHGLTRNAADFEQFAPLVASLGRRVLVPDVRGRGRSARDPDPANYSTRVYVSDVVRLMDTLGLARAVFVGTSMGGMITMMMAASHLDRVAGAVLNDIGPDIAEAGLTRIANYVGKPLAVSSWTEAAARLRDINGCAFPENEEAEWLEWARRAFEQGADGRLVARYDPAIGLGLQGNERKTTSPELQRAFRRLATERPVLLVRGALSDLLEPAHAEAMRAEAPALRYVEVPGVGHAPMLTEPAAFEAIAAFLADLP